MSMWGRKGVMDMMGGGGGKQLDGCVRVWVW